MAPAFFILIICLLVGSFLSVCIFRIPRGEAYAELHENDESFSPISVGLPRRSFCPQCNAQVVWWQNIPVVSWLLLRGKCAHCRAPISSRYPFVELLSALCGLLAYFHYGLTPTGVLVYLVCAALIVITFIDYDYFIIPNIISLPGAAIGIAIAVVNEFYSIFSAPVVSGLWDCFFGLLAGAGLLWFVAEVYFRLRGIEGLGMGDVKLLAMVGALFGKDGALFTIFFGSLVGTFLGLAFILFGRHSFKNHLPFGPYPAAGTVTFLFARQELTDLYLSIIRALLVIP